VYYILFPLGVLCECWILLRTMAELSLLSRSLIAILALAHFIGKILIILVVVAGVDIFVVDFGNIFVSPTVRAWIPVADGSHAF
jgi:hypothetical protein